MYDVLLQRGLIDNKIPPEIIRWVTSADPSLIMHMLSWTRMHSDKLATTNIYRKSTEPNYYYNVTNTAKDTNTAATSGHKHHNSYQYRSAYITFCLLLKFIVQFHLPVQLLCANMLSSLKLRFMHSNIQEFTADIGLNRKCTAWPNLDTTAVNLQNLGSRSEC